MQTCHSTSIVIVRASHFKHASSAGTHYWKMFAPPSTSALSLSRSMFAIFVWHHSRAAAGTLVFFITGCCACIQNVSRIPSHVLAALHASLALCSNQMSALQDDNDSVLFSTLVTDSVVAFLGGPQASHVPPPVWVISELVSQNWRASDPSTRGCRYARLWRQWRSSVLSPNARSLPIIFQRGSSTLAVGAHSVVMH